MLLFCWSHNRAHRFTPGEGERIVYALMALLHDAELAHAQRQEPPAIDSRDDPICPEAALRLAYDSEGYAEHVEQGVECRRDAQRVEGAEDRA